MVLAKLMVKVMIIGVMSKMSTMVRMMTTDPCRVKVINRIAATLKTIWRIYIVSLHLRFFFSYRVYSNEIYK